MGVVLVFRDVTGQKQTENELRESEQRLRAIIDNWPAVVFVKDSQGRYLLANRACERFSGEDRDQMRGKSDHDYLSAEVADRFRADDQGVLESGVSIRYEETFPVNGEQQTYLTVKFPLGDASGVPYAVCGIATDISDRKRAQDALRESERQWRNLAEALPNLVWTDLPDGQCDYLSSQWDAYTGIPVEELLGLNWLERVVHPDDRERTLACWTAAVADKADYDLEYRIRRHDGQYHWFKTRGVPIRDDQGRIVKWFGTCTDIEDQKQAREATAPERGAVPAACRRHAADRLDRGPGRQRRLLQPPVVRVHRACRSRPGQRSLGRHPPPRGLPHRCASAGRSPSQTVRRSRWKSGCCDRRTGGYRWHLVRTVPVRNEVRGESRAGTAPARTSTSRSGPGKRPGSWPRRAPPWRAWWTTKAPCKRWRTWPCPTSPTGPPWTWSSEGGTLRRLAVAHQDAGKIRLAHELMRRVPARSATRRAASAPSSAPASRRSSPRSPTTCWCEAAQDERHLRLHPRAGAAVVPLRAAGRVRQAARRPHLRHRRIGPQLRPRPTWPWRRPGPPGRRRHRERPALPGAARGRPPQGRVPGDARPRAAQPAGPDPQFAASPQDAAARRGDRRAVAGR